MDIFIEQEEYAKKNGGYLPGDGTITFPIADYPLDLFNSNKLSQVAVEEIARLEKAYPGVDIYIGDRNSDDVKALHILLK